MRRHLDRAEKVHVLREWRALRNRLPPRPAAESGCEDGYPDAEMVPWCEALNELPGICTLQSCAGHRRGDMYASAHLWLWLSAAASRRFDQLALELAAQPGIEQVSRLYAAWGQEIAVIVFAGLERDLLEDSMRRICMFAQTITAHG